MSELQILLKTVSVVLKSLADGIEVISDHLKDPQDDKSEKKPEDKADRTPEKKTLESVKTVSPVKGGEKTEKSRKGKSTAKAVKTKATARKKKSKKTDTEILLELIQNAENGIGQAELAKATGFSKSKIYNIVYRLKNKGKVKAERKGFYEKA